MSKMLFKREDYTLEHLVLDIDTGKLGLPDLQRPFVWKNAKVRELLDSMMKGYPIGYLLLWDAPGDAKNKQIGVASHVVDSPNQLIIDGQQRLTSLYAVMTGKEVLDEKFQQRPISIAFNPTERLFMVTTAALKKSPDWIPNISEVFANDDNSFTYIQGFISKLQQAREKDGKELTNHEKDVVARNVQDLLNLKKYVFPTLSITDDADEEAVSDIFVRVNSGGKSLNENDFILTLISVHDESVRREIEKFCMEAKQPGKGASSYNQIFEPKPSHIIRTTMAYGFERARLRYAYMLLRGKDMETGKYSEELREKNFDILRTKLIQVLNLNNWHEFIKCVLEAGYLAEGLIAAENALVYTYTMYLIGKYNFSVDAKKLRQLISRWFYMVSVTAYYSISTETTVQADLNTLKGLKSGEQFEKFINDKINSTFTNDYFEITLPNELATSAATSPAWNAYCAAQNILNIPALFSNIMMKVLFAPGSSGTKKSIEKHHLFPKAYLDKLGYRDIKETNQIANFAYIEWNDNITISDTSPANYWPEMIKEKSIEQVSQMMKENALPEQWVHMGYFDFLEMRRKLMAKIIKEGYESL
jgi:hypothetical protein